MKVLSKSNFKVDENFPVIIVLDKNFKRDDLIIDGLNFKTDEYEYIEKLREKKINFFKLPYFNKDVFINLLEFKSEKDETNLEAARIAGSNVLKKMNSYKYENFNIASGLNGIKTLTWLEGFLLATYSFEKYKSEKKSVEIDKINIVSPKLSKKEIDILMLTVESVFIARDLINEPGGVLTAEELSNQIKSIGTKAGFYTEIFNKSKIESLKMGGLLAVNKGSIDPPTFNILEWKPEKAVNKQPLVLVGKGIVFDTGGLSLKPTQNSMDYMKCDMSGAAAVIGVFNAVSKLKLPYHIIGLIPATDNRPGQNAYYPGDVINMYDGTTVEVLNTDAEGRMILADALAYAKKYSPELVINIATLTGSAMVATGKLASVSYFKTDENTKELIISSANKTYERIVEFPLWEEYAEMLKSDIADLKNIGGREAGSITAAKFLEHFTDYPFIHLDIAGTAFSFKTENYLSPGGIGVMVRLLIDYIIQKVN